MAYIPLFYWPAAISSKSVSILLRAAEDPRREVESMLLYVMGLAYLPNAGKQAVNPGISRKALHQCIRDELPKNG